MLKTIEEGTSFCLDQNFSCTSNLPKPEYMEFRTEQERERECERGGRERESDRELKKQLHKFIKIKNLWPIKN
jgi:hypothetical protein